MSYAFFFIGLIFGLAFYLALRRAKTSQTWPITEGTITGTSLEARYDDEGDFSGYIPHVHYAYTVEGEQLTSDHYGLTEKTMSETKANQFLALFEEGQRVKVHYNPKRHEDAVLNIEISKLLYFLIAFFFILMGIGLYLIINGWIGSK